MCHMYINNLWTLGDAKDLRRLTAPDIQISMCGPVSLPQSAYVQTSQTPPRLSASAAFCNEATFVW